MPSAAQYLGEIEHQSAHGRMIEVERVPARSVVDVEAGILGQELVIGGVVDAAK